MEIYRDVLLKFFKALCEGIICVDAGIVVGDSLRGSTSNLCLVHIILSSHFQRHG